MPKIALTGNHKASKLFGVYTIQYSYNKKTYILRLESLKMGKNGQNCQISVFCSKSVFKYGGITSQIFRGLAALEPPPKWGAKEGKFIFFVFDRKRKIKLKKYFIHFVGNHSRILKLFFFILA